MNFLSREKTVRDVSRQASLWLGFGNNSTQNFSGFDLQIMSYVC